MADTKDKNPNHKNALPVSGLSAKTVTGVEVYMNGSVMVWEIQFSGGQQYLKCKQGQAELGGTHEWGTGTVVL